MKCKFLAVCLVLGLSPALRAATSDFYVNDSVVICPPQLPPQVDATNFINNNFLSVNFTNAVVLPNGQITILPSTFLTANTRNFTNTGVMFCNGGFTFDWFDTIPVQNAHKMAANFVNSGTISSGSGGNTNLFFGLFLQNLVPFKYQISATNVSLRSSTNIVGVDGLLSVVGKRVDMNRATLAMEGFEVNPDSLNNTVDTVGMSAAYWGVGTNIMNPAGNFEASPARTPFSLVTTPGGFVTFQSLSLPGPKFYIREAIFGTNRTVQAVFVNNTNAGILNNVYFPFNGVSVVEWLGLQTNAVTSVVTTNHLYLTDTFGLRGSNYLVANFSYYSANGTAIPVNYNFSRFVPYPGFMGPPAVASSPAGQFDPTVVTNEYSAFGALFSPTTVALTNLPPPARLDYTNLPGRTEISAAATLDLELANITALNYLALRATNHIVGMAGATITSPFSDISLATTNGSLTISNLLAPTVQRFAGGVELWSGRWTNDFAGIETRYSVLFVDSHLSPTAPAVIQDLSLRSTNVLIGDILNVSRGLLINAERVTLISNQPPSLVAGGELNILSTATTWPGAFPRLQYLTNHGVISSLNSVFFGGSRTSPFYSSNFNEPYLAFVNHGTVKTEGSLVWSKYFENTGRFTTGTGFGSISLLSTDTRLTNGSFVALNGDVTIVTGDLTVTNHLFLAGRTLSLSATNLLTDTGTSNANAWVVGKGFSIPVKPVLGDLLGTTITDTAAPGAENVHTLAGQDRGVSTSGYVNNAALGWLTLNGQNPNSLFTFVGAGVSNALYVDYLDLRNYATNINLTGNLTELNLDPNIVLYYAQAVAGDVSVAERINNANNGRLRWVASYAGIYSSTNLVYPDGTTNALNAALVQSHNIDSDGDGLVNANDPTPILRSQDLALKVVMTNVPPAGAMVSWRSVPGSTNTLFFRSSLTTPVWLPLTNVVAGPMATSVSVFDPMAASGTRYYRVEVSVPQP